MELVTFNCGNACTGSVGFEDGQDTINGAARLNTWFIERGTSSGPFQGTSSSSELLSQAACRASTDKIDAAAVKIVYKNDKIVDMLKE